MEALATTRMNPSHWHTSMMDSRTTTDHAISLWNRPAMITTILSPQFCGLERAEKKKLAKIDGSQIASQKSRSQGIDREWRAGSVDQIQVDTQNLLSRFTWSRSGLSCVFFCVKLLHRKEPKKVFLVELCMSSATPRWFVIFFGGHELCRRQASLASRLQRFSSPTCILLAMTWTKLIAAENSHLGPRQKCCIKNPWEPQEKPYKWPRKLKSWQFFSPSSFCYGSTNFTEEKGCEDTDFSFRDLFEVCRKNCHAQIFAFI